MLQVCSCATHQVRLKVMWLQVVVQPYLKMVLMSLSAGISKYIKSAAPLPIEWRYMIELSVHNSGPVDITV